MPFNPLKNDEQMKYSLDIGEGVQFSHSLEEQIGGQLKTGFMITDIYEDTELDGFLFDKNISTIFITVLMKKKKSFRTGNPLISKRFAKSLFPSASMSNFTPFSTPVNFNPLSLRKSKNNEFVNIDFL